MPQSLALHPDQPEVAARRAMRAVAFVEDDEIVAERAHAVGDRGADQSAADDRRVEFHRRHVANASPATAAPAKRRIAGICAMKPWYA